MSGIPKMPKIKMPGISMGQMPNKVPMATFSPDAFEQLIREMGIRFVHARPMPSPHVKSLRGDDMDPGDNTMESSYIYYGHKEFIGAFQGNSNQRQFAPNGSYDDDTATIVIPTKYTDGTDMDVQIFDRIIAIDAPKTRYYQRVEHDMSGHDRLHFPAISVDLILGNNDQQFAEGVDFKINERGMIEWISGGRRPGYDPMLDKGEIYSISYYMQPYFTVLQLPHFFRMAQTRSNGPGSNNTIHRFPQLCTVRKDYIAQDPNDSLGSRYADEPKRGTIRSGR